MKKRNMRKLKVKIAFICLSCLGLMMSLMACGASKTADEIDDKQDVSNVQTDIRESENVETGAESVLKKQNFEEETAKESEGQTIQTAIHTIRITDGATGEERIFTLEEKAEEFVEIIEKFDALDVEKSENQTAIVGYVYWLRLEDENGKKLHSIVPRGQEIQIDGVNYADYSKGTAMELFLAVDAVWAELSGTVAGELSGADLPDNAQTPPDTQSAVIQEEPGILQEADTLAGVSMEVTYATSRGANLVFFNDTDLEINYGEDYSLQAFRDGLWYDVEYIIDDAAFNAIAYNVPQGGFGSWGVRWTFFHGELPQGTYRIVKGVMDFRGTGDYTTYHLAAEFTVK